MEKLQGPDPRQWKWGGLHFSYWAHPLSGIVDAATRAQLNVGPYPHGGGTYTINLSSYSTANFQQIHGPSFRVIVDVGNWDNSRAMNTPGQSGDPANPHYRDLAPMWAAGQYFPLLYSKAAVDAATVETIELAPRR
jgi:penicillin amidase